jgi:acetamidase/formamidase
MAEHFLDDSITQPFWDNAIEPRLAIRPGDTVTFQCAEPCGQVTPDWTADDLGALDFERVHALNGSVFVEGAEPGDALEVRILDMQHTGWGWSGHLPGFGLLADDFDYTYIHHWEIAGDECRFALHDIVLPFDPFPGVVGVAPAESGRLDTIPPRVNGGNVDLRDLVVGCTFWLPVLVPGALFATGDCHAAQGHGEVCGTGIESPMTVTMQFDVRKDLAVPELQVQRPGPPPRTAAAGYHVTTAHGPDLMENARNAVRAMIDWLERTRGVTRSQAYILCSTAADVSIAEIVDAPNWLVAARMPLVIFR